MKSRRFALLVLACAVLLVAAWPAFSDEPVSVSGSEQQKKLKNKVRPVYPPEAKAAGVEGQVLLKVIIDEAGSAKTVTVVSGPPELTPAAVDAVKQWTWEPTYVNGIPVSVKTDVQVIFKLEK